MIDLTEITEEIVSNQWDVGYGYAETAPWAELPPQQKAAIKTKLLPLIAKTAEETERRVRESVAEQIRSTAMVLDLHGHLERPLRKGAEVPTDFANDFEWAAMLAEGSA